MPTIDEAFRHAKRVWATEGMHLVSGEVRESLTRGEFGIKSDLGNLRARVDAEVMTSGDGFEYGTSVNYGVFWQLGITKQEKILTAGPGKFFMIPVGNVQSSRVQRGKAFKNDLRQVGGMAKTKKGVTSVFLFRKHIRQPAQYHEPRPWLSGPLDKAKPDLARRADELFQEAVDKSIPNRIVKI